MMNTAESHPAICLEGVQLFTGAERVPGEYHEVAVLNSRGDAGMTSTEGMIKSQRKKAAALAGHGGARVEMLGGGGAPGVTRPPGGRLGTCHRTRNPRQARAASTDAPAAGTRRRRVGGPRCAAPGTDTPSPSAPNPSARIGWPKVIAG
jgi:hypothetical protein